MNEVRAKAYRGINTFGTGAAKLIISVADYKRTQRVIAILAIGYTSTYLAWRVLLLSSLYAHSQVLQISEILGAWFYLPFLPLIIASIVFCRRYIITALIIPVVLFNAEYGRQFLPNWQLMLTKPIQSQMLRVMTWNTLFTFQNNRSFQSIVQKYQPDIIALHEVSKIFNYQIPAYLENIFPYRIIHHQPGTILDMAILSRYPLREELSVTASDIYKCFCIATQVNFGSTWITVMATHLSPPNMEYGAGSSYWLRIKHFDTSNQRSGFEWLERHVKAIDSPLILMGDFNTTERQPYYRQLSQQLTDAFAAVGWGMGNTYPSPVYQSDGYIFPLIRIDHIFHSDHWLSRQAWTGHIDKSDHQYVMADLELLLNSSTQSKYP